MDWGNAIVRKISKSSDGAVESIEMELHLEGDFKKTEKKITWLSTSSDAPRLIPASLVDFDYLLTKKKIEEGEDWLNFVTPVTEFRKDALVDSNCGALEPGAVIQFERKGYFILDSVQRGPDGRTVSGMDFFLIPDGKVATVASKADKSASTGPVPAKSGLTYAKEAVDRRTGGSAQPMYSVKPVYGSEYVDVGQIPMYKVKPVY